VCLDALEEHYIRHFSSMVAWFEKWPIFPSTVRTVQYRTLYMQIYVEHSKWQIKVWPDDAGGGIVERVHLSILFTFLDESVDYLKCIFLVFPFGFPSLFSVHDSRHNVQYCTVLY
jgi:hypothetical protein